LKRLLLLALVLVLALAMPLAAQTFDFGGITDSFGEFSDEVAGGLTFNSNIGLNWSDAYIGNLPHFGVGLTVGATTIPFAAANKVIQETINVPLPAEVVSIAEQYGMPIPGLTAEARIGGLFGLPFDIGAKFGTLPPELGASLLPSNMSLSYLLAGADVRFALLQDEGATPAISVGGGVNYMEGGIGLKGLLGGSQDITIETLPGFDDPILSMSDPDFNFGWNAFVIDLKAQISKSLFIVTPYLGFGASLGVTNVGGGLSSSAFTIDADGTGPGPAATPTQTEIDQLLQDLEDAGFEVPAEAFSETGFNVSSATNGWSFRAFGGLSLDLWIIRLDATAMYDITSGALGGSVNTRIQF
jgi:hypothetical protein